MQTKIKFTIMKTKNNEVIKEIRIDQNEENLRELEIQEYSGLKVELLTKNKNSYLEFDYLGDSSDEKLLIDPNQETILFEIETVRHRLVPGRYKYRYFDGSRYIEGMYYIRPSATKWEELIKIREYINSYVENLALNFFKKNYIDGNELINLDPSILYIKSKLDRELKKIMSLIRDISLDPLESLKKTYEKSSYIRNVDNRIQRDLLKKSNYNNIDLTIINKKINLEYDNTENVLIKFVIKELIKIIIIVEEAINNEIMELEAEYDLKEEKVRKIENEIKQLYYLQRYQAISNSKMNSYKTKLNIFNKEMCDIEYKLDRLNDELNYFNKTRSTIMIYLENSKLKEVREKGNESPTLKFLKDSRYLSLYNIYKDLTLSNNDNKKDNQINYMAKDTPTLFEYYSLIMVLEVLKDLNYEWVEGWLANNTNIDLLINDIPEEEDMVFINKDNGLKIIVCYEKRLKEGRYLYENKISDFIRLNQHYNPDITLAILSNDNNKFIDGIIIECKCYKERYLKPNENFKVTEQLISYRSLKYNDPNKKPENTVNEGVSKVIVTYPMENQNSNIIFDRYKASILYIPIKPYGETIRNHLGFARIKSEISEILDKAYLID